MCSPSWTHLPPRTIPLGHPNAPAPSILYPALNLDWRFISYMIYMFQCHSPYWSHPLPLPQSPKDCSIHLCLMGLPCGSAGKESACNMRELGMILGLGRSPREGNSYPLQYSGLENSMDCIVQGVTKSQTWLSDFHSLSFMVRSLPLYLLCIYCRILFCCCSEASIKHLIFITIYLKLITT